MTTTDRRLADIATGQLGIVRRQGAHAAGVTDRQLRSRVQSGTLIQTGPHSFRLHGDPMTPIGQLRSLLADLGGGAFASGPTAAALHGFDGFRLAPPFDVTLLRGRNMRRIGHRIHTTIELDLIDRSEVQCVPALSPARTVVDLARWVDERRLAAALDSGRRDGLFTDDLLHRRIVALRRSGRYGIPTLLSVIESSELAVGADSWLEREFLRLIVEAELPMPTTQQVLSRAGDRLVRVDFHFPATPVVIEVLGYRYHRTATQMTRDAERTNALLSSGYVPFQFTYAQVVADPATVMSTVSSALRTAAAS
jgi:hypothetical protein